MNDVDRIIRIAARGDGVTADGRHVPRAAPGDRLLGNGGLERGPHHVDPVCVHVPDCGGCQLQHVDDSALAGYVRDRVAGALAGQGVTVGDVLNAHLSPPASRRRASLRAEKLSGRIQIGFSGEGSHRIVDMSMCAVLHPALFALVAPLRRLLDPMIGAKRAVQIKLTLVDQGVDLLIEGLAADDLSSAEALSAFAEEHKLGRLSLDDGYGPQTRSEPEPVTVTFDGVPVAFPPYAFLQATTDGEAALVAAAAEALHGAVTIADLFSGLGTFALSLAGGRKVYAAEAARDLVLSLKAAGNQRPGTVFVEHRDLFRRPLTPVELNRFDAVLIDPPRAGAREQVEQIAQSQVQRLVYVSCNPMSFARDAKTLVAAGYRLDRVKPVGQFRWSTHVELVAAFTR